MRHWIHLLILLAAAPAGANEPTSEPATPQWIWAAGEPRSGQTTVLTASLELNGSVQDARLLGGADFCHCQVVINGQRRAGYRRVRRLV